MTKTSGAFALALSFLLAACGGANSESAAQADGAAVASQASDEKKDTQKIANASGLVKPDDMVLGEADAPVTIIEYASVTCPGCASFHKQILPEIKEKYVETGKVKFIFREFPTPPVEFSYIGSLLARCAADKSSKEAYFAVIDGLFNDQRAWIYGEDPKVELLKIGAQVGIDEAGFDACLKRQDLIDALNERVEVGRTEYEVNSTPSLFLDGNPVRVTELTAEIDKALGLEPVADEGDAAEGDGGNEDASDEGAPEDEGGR